MSFYDLACVFDGFRRAQGSPKPPPSDEEDEALRLKYADL